MAKKKKTSDAEKSSQSIPFEQSLVELDRFVGELEDGNLSLTDSLQKYEQAVKHLRGCYQQLDQAEKKVKLLTGFRESDDEQIVIETEDFDDGETDMSESAPQTRRVKRKATRKVRETHVEDDLESDELDEVSDDDDDVDPDDDMDDEGTLF